jgi:hypothetical protein
VNVPVSGACRSLCQLVIKLYWQILVTMLYQQTLIADIAECPVAVTGSHAFADTGELPVAAGAKIEWLDFCRSML